MSSRKTITKTDLNKLTEQLKFELNDFNERRTKTPYKREDIVYEEIETKSYAENTQAYIRFKTSFFMSQDIVEIVEKLTPHLEVWNLFIHGTRKPHEFSIEIILTVKREY